MNFKIELPVYITPLMRLWLIQYYDSNLNNISVIGLFHWKYSPNKRKPEKPRRIPRLDQWLIIDKKKSKSSIYFFQPSENKLHVFESTGLDLSGYKIAIEYDRVDNKFIKTQVLLKMIS